MITGSSARDCRDFDAKRILVFLEKGKRRLKPKVHSDAFHLRRDLQALGLKRSAVGGISTSEVTQNRMIFI